MGKSFLANEFRAAPGLGPDLAKMVDEVGMNRPGKASGFSLIELLTVAGIIALAAAISLPYIMEYVRTSRIRSAASEIQAEIQAARGRAIARNVGFGVVFVALSSTSYQYLIEDDMVPPINAATRPDLGTLAGDEAQRGQVRQLPIGVEFELGGANDSGFRIDRLGAWCDPTASNQACPALVAGSLTVVNAFVNSTSGTIIRLKQPSTGLTRQVTISTGGRVLVQ
jgi:prepilin-type N-terminal cleavage/methylation domain-containing protein